LSRKAACCGGFNAFHRYAHIQLASERDDRFHYRFSLTAGAVEALHETAVDLDFVERETPQIA
jgi:hypothetical protein